MRNKKAKQIRKEVYGDYSHRDRRYTRANDGSIRNVGLRAVFLKAKAEYKK